MSEEFSYYFKRPTVPSYDRYIKTAAQGITKASKAFMLDAVIDEDAERLTRRTWRRTPASRSPSAIS